MMRFVDFLIFLLQTQGDTLKRLAAFFGEEELITLLESADELPNEKVDQKNAPANTQASSNTFVLKREWFDESNTQTGRKGAAYYELEDTVREMKLPPQLEFHLWAYPFYRILIESGTDLDALIQTGRSQGPLSDPLDILIAETVHHAKEWVNRLPIPPAAFPQAEAVAMTPWLRFRAHVLTKAGKKLLSPLPPS